MGSPVARLGFLAMVLVVLGAAGCGRAKTEDAYVTLLYGDEFLLGVRVLGKSIRDTGSTKDMVVLVSDGVSDYAKKLLDVGDQGFLNSYYSDFPNAHVFEPDLSSDAMNSIPVPEMQRLSTLYNADVGLYMLANKFLNLSRERTAGSSTTDGLPLELPQLLLFVASAAAAVHSAATWMVDEKELRVIHYTLGPLKPWDWWTAWLLKPVDVWQINKDFTTAFSRSSLCDYARRIYYRYRSGGIPAYSGVGVASSSFVNSSQQVAFPKAKLGLMVGGGLILAAFVTFSSEHLAIRAFTKGCEDRHQPRARNICLLC
ncbi:cryptochrome 2 [Musa troglodytarum]|uniref:Cryptochrome 2 n=1 Tax=Musa troglodytarum TaxID=320322 RepID=A0A9E7G1L3_9LILI|nr:cryptochrome 2 [Musa troglodytarum]